jgi:hypothetical protein
MMNQLSDIVEQACLKLRSNLALLILLCLHTVICCVSLVLVSHRQAYILYDERMLTGAVVVVALISFVSLLFASTRFSFGYFVGFYFYTMVLGFLWINQFTKFNYDHKLAGASAAASILLFLLPALLIDAPIKQAFALSIPKLERLLTVILLLSATTIAVASIYNFRLVSLKHIYDFRDQLQFPTIIRYLIGMTSSALLPFAFACYWTLNYRWWGALTLLLLVLFYPITLSKYAFFAPAWIITLLVLSKIFESRATTILSLFLPVAIGVILILITSHPIHDYARAYFNIVNIRMIATPSSAMDIYNDFFSFHPLTSFCQISFLKPLTHCPYQEPLSVVMENTYGFGNLNASLFTTEGIASVGLIFAPLAALACGLVIGLGNRLSAGLSSRFILVSGALLPQALLNVPLTTVLLTHGAAILFLLWYIMPREMFGSLDQKRA